MTYPQAQEISLELATSNSHASAMLRSMCEQTGRVRTFIIMRYGDPRQWKGIPFRRDGRAARITRPSSPHGASKIIGEVFVENGRAAVALRRRARAMKRIGCKDPIMYVVMRDGDPRQWREVTANLKSKKARKALSLARTCELEHPKSGRRIRAASIVEFCAKAGIPNSRYHITPILDGSRLFHKGWYLPAFLDRVLDLKDIYGNVSQLTVREWVKRGHTAAQANRLLTGQTRSEKGSKIMLASTVVDSLLKPRDTMITQIKLTDGKRVFTGDSINAACQNAGLSQPGNVYQMAYGFRDEARGLRVKSVKVAKKRVVI